jgi:capsular exopolysaccharide synthesis family protein
MPHNSFASEQYRNLATQVEEYVAARKLDRPVLVVTSADPGSGKTVTSLNLAISLARRGERNVLLIEGDLLKPSFGTHLQRDESAPGLSDVLSSKTTVHARSVVATMWNAGIDILFAGSRVDIADLVTASRIEAVLDELRAHYELIVIDSPPFVLSVGRALLASADAALIVVRAGKSVDRSVEEALSIIGPDKTLGLVLNDVSMKALRYGAYGAGSYGSYGAYGAYAAYEAYEKEASSRLTVASAGVHGAQEPSQFSATEERRRRLRRLSLRVALIVGLLAAIVGLGYWMGFGRGGSSTHGSGEAEPGAASPPESDHLAAGWLATPEPPAPGAAEQSTTGAPDEPGPATASVATTAEPILSEVTFTLIGSADSLTLLTMDHLNLRREPAVDGARSSVLPPGLEVEVQESSGNWRRVSTAVGEGWVRAEGLVEPEELTEADSDATHRTTARVNLRGGPGLEQPLVLTLPKSLPVTATKVEDDWARVTTWFGEGWLNRTWLEEIEPAAEQLGGGP